MKRVIAFILFLLSFVVLLYPSTEAQRHEPYGSYQRYKPHGSDPWEGAEAYQLLFNDSKKSDLVLYIDDNDKLFLFYKQRKWDPEVQPYRDTLYLITKEKNGEWTQAEKIGYTPFDLSEYKKYLGYDVKTGVTHILYIASQILYYTNSNIPNWEVTTVDSLSEEMNQEYNGLAMAFDTLGNVHLAWNVDYCSLSVHWYKGMYANNSTGEWVKQQVSPPVYIGYGESGPLGHLTVQKNGTAHLMYNCLEPQEYYARNDSLNDTNWVVDTLPIPSIPFYYYYGYEIMADENDSIHLFTGGGEDWEYKTGYFDFYYYKQSKDSIWIGPDSTYQPEPDDLQFWGAFIDPQGHLHASLVMMGFMIPSHNYFYTNNKQGNWVEPYQILYTEPYWPSEFRFVIDSEGRGHGVFIGHEPGVSWDTSGIYYLGVTTGVEDEGDQNQRFSFHLFQNFPNPFNTSTVINYELKEDSYVKLDIYNLLGRKVRTLEDGERSKGWYRLKWDGKDNDGKEVASGIYFYQLKAGDYINTKRMLLVK